MVRLRVLAILCFGACSLLAAQAPPGKSALSEPALPVIYLRACPFEGCKFRKWIVIKEVTLYSNWKEHRKPLVTLKNGEVVIGITGVHITYEPDRIQVLQPLPELQLHHREKQHRLPVRLRRQSNLRRTQRLVGPGKNAQGQTGWSNRRTSSTAWIPYQATQSATT
jgi:hypothetical protein